MHLAVPLFMLFAVYGVINPYLPVLLRYQGYSATEVGFLLAAFEASGIVFPVLIGPVIERKKLYIPFLIFSGILMAVMSIPLVFKAQFLITLLCLIIHAVGLKGSVPISDTLTNLCLGNHKERYGRIRVFGSIGFIVMSLLLQKFMHMEENSKTVISLWFLLPSVLFTVSMFFVPRRIVDNAQKEFSEQKKDKTDFSVLKNFSKKYYVGIILIFFCFFAVTPSSKFISIYTEESLNLSYTGLFWAISAMSEVPFMFFSDKFIKKFKSFDILIFCALVCGIRQIIYILFPTMAGVIAAQMLNSVTYGMLHPVAVYFASENAPENGKVLSMSLYSIAAVGLAAILGNAIGGVVIDNLGFAALFWGFGLIPFVFVAFLLPFRKRLG